MCARTSIHGLPALGKCCLPELKRGCCCRLTLCVIALCYNKSLRMTAFVIAAIRTTRPRRVVQSVMAATSKKMLRAHPCYQALSKQLQFFVYMYVPVPHV